MKKTVLVIFCFVAFLFGNSLFAQDTFLLRNAYETAKWLEKAGKNNLSKDSATRVKEQRQLITALIYYADLQDVNPDSAYKKLFDTITPYNKLAAILNKISDSLSASSKFFSLDTTNAFFTTPRPDSLRLQLRDSLKRYMILNASVQQQVDLINHVKQSPYLLVNRDSLNEIYTSVSNSLKDTSMHDPVLRNSLKSDSTSLKLNLDSIDSVSNKLKDATGLLSRLKDSIYNLQIATNDLIRKKKSSLSSLFGLGISEFTALPSPDDVSEDLQNNLSTTIQLQTTIAQAQAAALSSFHIPSESEAISALAIYLANRIKQEAVLWFFETITRNANRFELVSTFFPTTIKLLQGNEVYEAPNMGSQWQYALSKDFVNMPQNVLRSKWLRARLPAGVDSSYLIGAGDLASLILQHNTYREIIKTLYLHDMTVAGKPRPVIQFNDFIKLLYAINSELFLPDTANKFRMLKYEDYKNMNRDQLEIMLSLIDMKYGKVFTRFLHGMTMQRFAFSSDATAENIRRLLGQIESAVSDINNVRTQFIADQQEGNGDKSKWFYNSYTVWNSVTQLFNVFVTSGNPVLSYNLKKYETPLTYASRVYEIYNLISTKNFSGAVENTIDLVTTILYNNSRDSIYSIGIKRLDTTFKSNSKLLDEILKAGTSVVNRTDSSAYHKDSAAYNFKITDTTVQFKRSSPMAAIVFEKDRHALQIVRSLGAFLNDAALAQDDKQLAKVVQSYASPPGSYKRKRNNWWSLDLNAFGGPYIGHEWTFQQKQDTLNSAGSMKGYTYGFSVPIGLSISKTFGRKHEKGTPLPQDYIANPNKLKLKKDGLYTRTNWTVTFTASLIDLGALVSYRLGHNEDTVATQEFKWSQFISPGAHIGIAIPQTPLVLSIGAEYTPQLRRYVIDNKVNEHQYNAVRLYAGLMFDMPLLNLWEKKRIAY